MRLRELRAECPDWHWSAERSGMGWRYVGSNLGEKVTVYAVGMLCGPSEDDFATVWRVDDGSESVSYATWWLRQESASPRPEPQDDDGGIER